MNEREKLQEIKTEARDESLDADEGLSQDSDRTG
jgi:hypothetical protein